MSTHNRKATVVGAFEDTKKHKQFLLLKCLRSIHLEFKTLVQNLNINNRLK